MTASNEKPFQRWLQRLLNWFRQWIGVEPEPTILEELFTDYATILRIESEEPGVVESWRIIHRFCWQDLLVTLIYIPWLREDLGRYRSTDSNAPTYADWQSSLTVESMDKVPAAHLLANEPAGEYVFMVTWISRRRFKQPDEAGRDRFVRRTECRCAVICDLEGHSRYWTTRHHAARKITRVIVDRLGRMSPGKYSSVPDLINKIDWLKWLEFYTKRSLGKNHILQPKRFERF